MTQSKKALFIVLAMGLVVHLLVIGGLYVLTKLFATDWDRPCTKEDEALVVAALDDAAVPYTTQCLSGSFMGYISSTPDTFVGLTSALEDKGWLSSGFYGEERDGVYEFELTLNDRHPDVAVRFKPPEFTIWAHALKE